MFYKFLGGKSLRDTCTVSVRERLLKCIKMNHSHRIKPETNFKLTTDK